MMPLRRRHHSASKVAHRLNGFGLYVDVSANAWFRGVKYVRRLIRCILSQCLDAVSKMLFCNVLLLRSRRQTLHKVAFHNLLNCSFTIANSP